MNLRQFCTQIFLGGIRVIKSTVCWSGTEGPPPWLGPVSNIFFGVYGSDFLKLYNTHTGKIFVGISPIGIELMLSEYILGQYLTLIPQIKI